jgi:signal transduction histidine kinase
MESETARCGDIVKNLLDFSRQTKPKIEWVDLRELVGLSLTLIGHELKLKSIVLEKKIPAYLPLVLCDAKQIHQVILNLLGNAIEAMPEGGHLTLALSHDEAKNAVLLLIEDSGIGIPAEDLGHIFEPFFTTKEEGKGVGLGLSVVHGIVTKHGGTIEVASRVGRGTRFWVRLPEGKPVTDHNGREGEGAGYGC